MTMGMGASRQTAPLRDDYQMLEQKLARKMVGAPKPPRPPRPDRGWGWNGRKQGAPGQIRRAGDGRPVKTMGM